MITLLFLQWPLRDLFRGYSREANDLGQNEMIRLPELELSQDPYHR